MVTRFKPEEIASVLREEIARHRREMSVAHVGRVLEVGDGIVQILGLSHAMAGEMLEFETDQIGQVFNLEENSTGAVVYGGCEDIKAGQIVRSTEKLLEVPVGDAMLGRVVDPLGRPLDGRGEIETDEVRPVERPAPGIAGRQPVYEPLHTGVIAVDSMIPIGRGQRELIIGDRKTGKTAVAVDAIINQRDTDVLCVYVAIGQKESTVAAVVDTLRAHQAMDETVVISAASSMPAPLQYIAPYCGCTVAEHFMQRGRATLIVYDDLTKQAAAYRQISLLLRRPPGREAYPGDIFYLHSRLLERACKLAERYVIVPKEALDADAAQPSPPVDGREYVGVPGRKEAEARLAALPNADALRIHRLPESGGSMTAFPICETQEGQVEAYIPTNLISITDGQIYLEPSLFFAGVRPAVNVGISVSRVGYKAAYPAMKEVAKSLRLDLAAYRELETFAQLGMDLDASSQSQLERGERMVRLLTQPQYQPLPVVDQIIAVYAGSRGYLDDAEPHEVHAFISGLLDFVSREHEEFRKELAGEPDLTAERSRRLRGIVEQFRQGPWEGIRVRRQRRGRRGGAAVAAKRPPAAGPEEE